MILATTAAADDPKPVGKETAGPPEVFELTVSPAAEPIPALRYHLLPPPEQLISGNAAPIYLRLAHEQSQDWVERLRREPSRLTNLPEGEFPLADAQAMLKEYEHVTDELHAAGKRADCDWEYVVEHRDPLSIRLPDANFSRNYARLLHLKVRTERIAGDWNAALASMQDGLALGRHVARSSILVTGLAGIAIQGLVMHELDALVATPNAPNLYWALAELPRPMISFEGGLGTERKMLDWKFPELARLNASSTPAEWERLAREMRNWSSAIIKSEWSMGLQLSAEAKLKRSATTEQLDMARAFLKNELGLKPDVVAAMSPAEVEVRYSVALWETVLENWQKWFYLPYPQALPRALLVDKNIQQEAAAREIYPLASVLVPLTSNVLIAQAKLDRRVARLQAIEALRMHAAATGTLPEKLDDVTIVPVPVDPATGKSFAYQLEAGVATLDIVEELGMPRDSLQLPLRIKLRAKH